MVNVSHRERRHRGGHCDVAKSWTIKRGIRPLTEPGQDPGEAPWPECLPTRGQGVHLETAQARVGHTTPLMLVPHLGEVVRLL